MIFRQLFEPVSSSFTYLIGCELSRRALLIDPVINAVERDLALLAELDLQLYATLETHIHADHISAGLLLKEKMGSAIALPALEQLPCADIGLIDGELFQMGGIALLPIHTPGHTDGHFAYLWQDRLFTGDVLLIDGCGRTDFQNGSSRDLFHSVRQKLFSLPDETLVYPGHDYKGRRVSCIGQERRSNARLAEHIDWPSFEQIMANLTLPYPAFIDHAVPGNRQCGVCPANLSDAIRRYCEQMECTPQG